MSKRDLTDDALVGCPFYLWSDNRSLCCEGHCAEMKTISRFSREADKRDYVTQRCAARYRLCPVYQATMAKYED